jgi:hypothetical protein
MEENKIEELTTTPTMRDADVFLFLRGVMREECMVSSMAHMNNRKMTTVRILNSELLQGGTRSHHGHRRT